jgi:uncharacterized membrane protein
MTTPTNYDVTQPDTNVDYNDTEQKNEQAAADNSCPIKKSRFSPTAKGALIGAVAGSILPVFGTISGAIIGAIGGKVYEKRCLNKTKY